MERCFGSVKNSLQKKQGAVSHFSTEGDQTQLITNKLPTKVCENRPCRMRKYETFFRHGAISRYSRWKFGRFRFEITSYLIRLIQTYCQFAYTNIIKLFNTRIIIR